MAVVIKKNVVEKKIEEKLLYKWDFNDGVKKNGDWDIFLSGDKLTFMMAQEKEQWCNENYWIGFSDGRKIGGKENTFSVVEEKNQMRTQYKETVGKNLKGMYYNNYRVQKDDVIRIKVKRCRDGFTLRRLLYLHNEGCFEQMCSWYLCNKKKYVNKKKDASYIGVNGYLNKSQLVLYKEINERIKSSERKIDGYIYVYPKGKKIFLNDRLLSNNFVDEGDNILLYAFYSDTNDESAVFQEDKDIVKVGYNYGYVEFKEVKVPKNDCKLQTITSGDVSFEIYSENKQDWVTLKEDAIYHGNETIKLRALMHTGDSIGCIALVEK